MALPWTYGAWASSCMSCWWATRPSRATRRLLCSRSLSRGYTSPCPPPSARIAGKRFCMCPCTQNMLLAGSCSSERSSAMATSDLLIFDCEMANAMGMLSSDYLAPALFSKLMAMLVKLWGMPLPELLIGAALCNPIAQVAAEVSAAPWTTDPSSWCCPAGIWCPRC